MLCLFHFFLQNDPLNFLPENVRTLVTPCIHLETYTKSGKKKEEGEGRGEEVEGSCNGVANRLAVPVARYVYIAISSPAMNLRQFTVQGIYGRWLPTNYYAIC